MTKKGNKLNESQMSEEMCPSSLFNDWKLSDDALIPKLYTIHYTNIIHQTAM